jgi:hypothetical protein
MDKEIKSVPGAPETSDSFPEEANFRRARGDEVRGYGAARKPSGGKMEKAGHRKETDRYGATE